VAHDETALSARDVPAEHVVPAHADLTFGLGRVDARRGARRSGFVVLDGRVQIHLDTGKRAAQRAAAVRLVDVVAQTHGSSLGEPVPLSQLYTGRVEPTLLQLGG